MRLPLVDKLTKPIDDTFIPELPRSWYDIISAAGVRLFDEHGSTVGNAASFRKRQRDALERLDGLGEVKGENEEMRKHIVEPK